MKKTISLLLTLVMIFGSLLTLVSCGAPDDDGAEINIYLGYEVFDFDPSDYYVSDAAEQVLSLLYEPLFKLKKNGKLQCAAADDYDVDEDERKIVITLRETYWSDNIKVKASDYVTLGATESLILPLQTPQQHFSPTLRVLKRLSAARVTSPT